MLFREPPVKFDVRPGFAVTIFGCDVPIISNKIIESDSLVVLPGKHASPSTIGGHLNIIVHVGVQGRGTFCLHYRSALRSAAFPAETAAAFKHRGDKLMLEKKKIREEQGLNPNATNS